MESCTFCRIARGEEAAAVLYENEHTVAFLDADPAVLGHSLVIPSTHREFLFTDDASITTAVFETVRIVSRAIDRAIDPDGISIFYTSPELVGRITHSHVHLVPRHEDDGIHLSLTRYPTDEKEAAALAERIRDALE